MSLHLLRFDPDMARSALWFASEKLLPRNAEDGGYAWHALLAAAFGTALAPKPFHLHARRNRPVQLLAYSSEDPATLLSQAQSFADPQVFAALRLGQSTGIAAKPMPAFTPGRRLGFSLRVRPTVRSDRDGDRTKIRERDAYLAALDATTLDAPPDRAEVYLAWTTAHLEKGGVKVISARIDGHERVETLRRNDKRDLKPVQGHAASVAGILEVSDAERFHALLARGIGRHRGFGYGMLLLSPPGA